MRFRLLLVLLLGPHLTLLDASYGSGDRSCSAVDAPSLANVQLQSQSVAMRSASSGSVNDLDDADLVDEDEVNASTKTAHSLELQVWAVRTNASDEGGLQLSAIQQRSTRLRLHSAARDLDRAVQELDDNWAQSSSEIGGVLGKLGEKISYSEDSCGSNLLMYQKKLKEVHTEVKHIAIEVKSTESGSQFYGKACSEKKGELSVLEKENKKRVKKCRAQMTVQVNTLTTLKHDMYEMRKVGVATTRPTYGPNAGHVRLLEILNLASSRTSADPTDPDVEARDVHSMVQRTKATAKLVQSCLAQSESAKRQGLSLLDEDEAEDNEALAVVTDNSSFGSNDTSMLEEHTGDQGGTNPLRKGCRHKKRGQKCSFTKAVRGPVRYERVSGVCMGSKYGHLKCATQKVPSECRDSVVELEKTFVKTYRSVTRLVEEYEQVSQSKVCFETAQQQYQSESSVVQTEGIKACEREKRAYLTLTKHTADYQRTIKIEHRLRKSLSVTKQECGHLVETEKYMKTVKKTIKALGNCPGLGKVKFSVPKWIGTYAYYSQRKSKSDSWNDRRMKQACQRKFRRSHGIRPAEVAEIDARTVRQIPKYNSADAPVLGACPMCEGTKNEGYSKERHGRICWDPKATFSRKGRRGDCNHGRRALICVLDRSYEG